MPLIEELIPWSIQPQYQVGIDRSNPLGKTITHCLPLNGYSKEIVTGATLTYGSGGSIGVDHRGKNLSGSGSAACASIPIDLSSYSKLSVSFWLYWNAYADDDDLALEYGANYRTNGGFIVNPNSSSNAGGKFDIGVGSAGPVGNTQYITRPSAAAWHHYVILFNRTTGTASACSAFVDGVAVTTTDSGTPGDVADNFVNNSLYLFSRNNASLFGAGRMQNLVLRGGYLMSAAEAKSEYDNPWQIFPPLSRSIYVASAGGAAALAGNAAAASSASGALTAAIPIIGAAATVSTAAGALSASIAMLGDAVVTSTAAGNLDVQIKLNGAAVANALAAAGLSSGIPLSASAAAQATASGDLSGNTALSGVAQAIATAFGSITAQIVLSGAAISQAIASGDLTAPGSGLSGAAVATATSSGQIVTAIPLVGAAQAYSTAVGGITSIVQLSAAAASVSGATGDLTVALTLSGAAIATALAGGVLTTNITLSGAAVSLAAASGVLAGGAFVVDRTWTTRPRARSYLTRPPQRLYIGSR